jgi:restriction system protein
MPEVTRRRTGELLRKLFEILLKHPEGLPAGEALGQLAEQVKLTPYEEGTYEKAGRRFDTIVRYATIDCVKAGWMVKAHGRWTVTDVGRDALKANPDPEAFYKRAVQLYHEWKKAAEGSEGAEGDGAPGTETTPAKRATITYEEADEQAWAEIDKYLHAMPPYEFQELVASLLRAMGYYVGWIAPPGKDGGTDIVAFNDPLGTRPPRIKVQVKRQQGKVSVDGVRSFMAILGADDVGIFVNAGGFTKDAEDEARGQHVRRVTLVDLERLVVLWTEHYPKLDEAARRRLPLQPIYFLAPEA